ncbi:uncharacterized protein MYCFIDRAFT_79191 [Pseudocercospora fijiensis CIRAD86]|uniref:Uncharacterized protein n=1 Tax=Pseudocercospora fijiensis (strain CIRAD86) TaxID=383855 RepID=M3AKF1_PSEFD|nr:uncharacterized protein MYCFIDRAFT_79191 [Pseudocercospora fijiensis CIRAD86]EME77947.1 hypothetical protein MYCFIDRAFT_79191 [Pseudocercospora fijiensis CIRAD86]
MSLSQSDQQIQDDEVSDVTPSNLQPDTTNLQPYTNSPSPEQEQNPLAHPNDTSEKHTTAHRLRFLAEICAMTNFKRARKRVEEMGEQEAFKLLRSSTSAERLAAREQLAADVEEEREKFEKEVRKRVERKLQVRTRRMEGRAGGLVGGRVNVPMSRRELVAMRRRKYFDNASGAMGAAVWPAQAAEDVNEPLLVTGAMSAGAVLGEQSIGVRAAEGEQEMADLTDFMRGTSL